MKTTLHTYEKVGVRVLYGNGSFEEFNEKGNSICRIIRELEDNGDNSDFYIPLDCDEFIALYKYDSITCSRKKINEYFDSIKNIRATYKINSSWYNVPGSPGWFCPRLYDKGFVERNTILELDHGFHFPKTTTSDRVFVTDFIYFHFHNKPLNILKEHAKKKIIRICRCR